MSPGTPEILRVIASLVLVFGLLGGLLWLLTRMQARLQNGGGKRRLSIVETINLGTRQKIVWVQMGDQQVLVGVTPNHISALTPVTAVAPAPGEAATSPLHKLADFKEELNRV